MVEVNIEFVVIFLVTVMRVVRSSGVFVVVSGEDHAGTRGRRVENHEGLKNGADFAKCREAGFVQNPWTEIIV